MNAPNAATSETAKAPDSPSPTSEATIHDAIEAILKPKEPPKEAAKEQEPVAPAPEASEPKEPSAETEKKSGDNGVEVGAKVEPAEKPQEKLSASEYAIRLARAKKKVAALRAEKAKIQPQTPAQPSAEIMRLAQAIEANRSDPLKAFEATGLDLAAIVQAYDQRRKEDPDAFPDPLAKEVRILRDEIVKIKNEKAMADDAIATQQFMSEAKTRIAAGGEKYEYLAAEGEDGLLFVKELVLEAHAGDPKTGRASYVLPLEDALIDAEEAYAKRAAKLAKTKKLAKLLTKPTRPPSIPPPGSPAGTAPETKKAPKSALDIIENELTALLG